MSASTPIEGITSLQPGCAFIVAAAATSTEGAGSAVPTGFCTPACCGPTAIGSTAVETAMSGTSAAATRVRPRAAAALVRRTNTARGRTRTRPKPHGSVGAWAVSGTPVLGSPGVAATPKHSDVALVCVAGVKMPALPLPGEYTVRQQYVPGVVVALVGSDVAAPAARALAAPTCVPPAGQPPVVVWPGAHRKNVTVPVGTGPAPPLPTTTESLAALPGATVEAGALLLLIAGSRHERRPTGPAKSLRSEVNDCAVRVCGRNELKQPPKGIPARSIPPSRKL